MKTTRLSPAAEKFILHWGEMGARWGVNRTVAQIHALLYLSERPLSAEEIAETLSVARSNVSVSLRELQSWKLARAVPTLGDRREHFEAHKDVWEMFKVILDGRKQREIDPTLEILTACAAESGGDKHTAERLNSMKEFFEAASFWYGSVRPMPAGVAKRLMKMGGKVSKILAVLLLCVGLSYGQSSDKSFSDSLSKAQILPTDEFKKLVKIGVAQYFRSHTLTARKVGVSPAYPALQYAVTLAPLKNKQWTSAEFFPLGGLRTWLSGQFSRSRHAYFAVMPQGAPAPAFIPIEDLLDGDAGILVNKVEYRLTLLPNLFDRLGSKVVFRRPGAPGAPEDVSMRRILDKVYRNGVAIDYKGKAFRLFCGQDVDDSGGAPAPSSKESLALLLPEGDGYLTFLVPLEDVPTDDIGLFELRPGLTMGLRLKGGTAEVY